MPRSERRNDGRQASCEDAGFRECITFFHRRTPCELAANLIYRLHRTRTTTVIRGHYLLFKSVLHVKSGP